MDQLQYTAKASYYFLFKFNFLNFGIPIFKLQCVKVIDNLGTFKNVFVVAKTKLVEQYLLAAVPVFEANRFNKFVVLSKDTLPLKCENCDSQNLFWSAFFVIKIHLTIHIMD